jgi:adenosylcobinamide-phosphate synthase
VSGWRSRGTAAATAVVLDQLIGDPRDVLHPVAWFGRAMASREARAWGDDRCSGARHLGAALALAGLPTLAFGVLARRVGGPAAERAASVAVVATTLGARSLDRHAAQIAEALASGRIDSARRALPALAGRDPEGLDEAEIARAVVESLAENSVDAVVAPLLWAAVAGPVGAATYRAVNTLDAMVGHRSDRYRHFGWASARADDLANFIPARVAAVLVALCVPRRAAQVVRAVREQAPHHPSPNAGVIEAAFAAALAVRLGGINTYGGVVEHRGELGCGRAAETADIARARRLARRVTFTAAVILALPSLLRAVRSVRSATARGGRRTPGDLP